MKKIIWIADWQIKNKSAASGYSNISAILCKELAKRHAIYALGFGYDNSEHNYPFSISTCKTQTIHNAAQSIWQGIKADKLVVCGDIPLQEMFLRSPMAQLDYNAIFAVESDPLCFSWAMELSKINKRFAISQFGADECDKMGVDTTHLPISIDLDIWHPSTPELKKQLKEILGFGDKPVFFINADGNERKNISAMFEAVQILKNKNYDFHVLLLTRQTSLSWKLNDLSNQLGITKYRTIYDRGLDYDELWKLYAVSDYVLNMSKAEGLCLPILEGMAVGTPPIATNATAMKESCQDGRGILVDYQYRWIDPFGNGNRYFVFPNEIAGAMENAIHLLKTPEYEKMVKLGRQYVESRNIENAVSLFEEKLFE